MTFAAILFDLDDTLIDRQAAYRGYLDDFVVRHPAAFPAGRRPLDVHTIRLLDDAFGNDRAGYYRRVAEVYPQTGMDAAALEKDYLAHVPRFVSPNPPIEPVLAHLRRSHRLGLVTNGASWTQRAKLKAAGLEGHLDHLFVSGEVGAHKPEPAIFERALEWTGCPPSQVLFVGDDPLRDISGAARAGMRTVWVAGVWRSRGQGPFPAGPDYLGPDWILDSTVTLLETVPGLAD
jgi:putative hydrolase of the HAD superfamily